MASTIDGAHRRLLVFGGRFRAAASGLYTLYNDVWSFDFATEQWASIAAANAGPSGRVNASAVYDAATDELVVFGGNTSRDGLQFVPSADVWALALATGTWRRVMASGTAPAARLFHAAAIRGRRMLVMDGGDVNAFVGPFFNDLNVLDLATSTWSSLTRQGDDPLGRINFGLLADVAGSRWIVLGGHDDGALGNRNDAFALADNGTFSTLVGGDTLNRPGTGFCSFPADFVTADLGAPERRSAFVSGVDPTRRRALLFGGKTDCGTTNDVWVFDFAMGRWQPARPSTLGVSCQRSGVQTCTSLCQ